MSTGRSCSMAPESHFVAARLKKTKRVFQNFFLLFFVGDSQKKKINTSRKVHCSTRHCRTMRRPPLQQEKSKRQRRILRRAWHFELGRTKWKNALSPQLWFCLPSNIGTEGTLSIQAISDLWRQICVFYVVFDIIEFTSTTNWNRCFWVKSNNCRGQRRTLGWLTSL